MEYWLNGSIWSGIDTTNTISGMQYWDLGVVYGGIFPTSQSTPVFIPIIMWFS